jgi:glycosyltransferase involved in cell wall biosynthesis
MTRLVVISFTGKNAAGGVPRWNRDFASAFPDHEVVDYCWDTFVKSNTGAFGHLPEWERAKVLNAWLRSTGKVRKDDIIVADGFWLSGLETFPKTVSVAHGIWSHLTFAEARAGKKPDMPFHHAAQLSFRKAYQSLGGRIVAVSDFIRYQMDIQFGIKSSVINNAIDLDIHLPFDKEPLSNKPLIIHGVNDKGNLNKGWDHIEALKKAAGNSAMVLSLDEAAAAYETTDKVWALSQADVVCIPSGYEGNSYFCLEALACNVPVFAYSVGLPYAKYMGIYDGPSIGHVHPKDARFPDRTVEYTLGILEDIKVLPEGNVAPRKWVSQFSIQNFREKWQNYFRSLGWL